MRALCLVLLMFFPFTAFAEGWEGSKVKIKKGMLLCDYFTIKKALVLEKSGDAESVNALISSKRCLRAPEDFIAIVTKDASVYTDPNLAEITLKGASIWGAMDDMDCCYK